MDDRRSDPAPAGAQRGRSVAALAAVLLALAVAAAWMVAGRGSPGAIGVPVVAPAKVRAGTPPPPPRGALVLARGHGALAVALAARRSGATVRLTATVVSPDGSGRRGLPLEFVVDGRALPAARPCGAGCYASATRAATTPRRVAIALQGAGHAAATVTFALPARWPVSAAPLLRRAGRAFAALQSVVYRERLSTGRRAASTSVWRSEAPDRFSYRTSDGHAGVVIGSARWDLVVGGGWKRGLQNPPLPMPAMPWGSEVYDVMLLSPGRIDGRAVVRLSLYRARDARLVHGVARSREPAPGARRDDCRGALHAAPVRGVRCAAADPSSARGVTSATTRPGCRPRPRPRDRAAARAG